MYKHPLTTFPIISNWGFWYFFEILTNVGVHVRKSNANMRHGYFNRHDCVNN